MNYAVPSNRPFASKSPVRKTAKMPPAAKARFDFIARHRFSIHVDPSKKKGSVEVTEIEK